MVPNGWKLTTLGDVCDGQLQTGPFGSQLHADEYEDLGVPVYMPKDIIDCRANRDNAAKVSDAKVSELLKHILAEGDLLFSRRGDVSRFALITKESCGGLCGTGCLRARPKDTSVSDYILYFLQKNQSKKWLEQNAVGQTMLNLNTSILSELPIIYPTDPAEQKKIVRILSTLDKAIETVDKLIENSKQQKKTLMQQLLTGKKRLPWHIKNKKYIKTKYGQIPQDWEFVPINKIATQAGLRNGHEEGIPVLSCSKYDGFVDSLKYFKKKVYSDDLSNYKVILRGELGFPSNHIEEGSIGIQKKYDKGLVSPIYTVIKPKNNINCDYLYQLLKTDHYRQIFSAQTNASVDRRGSLRWKEFGLIKVPLPSLDEQVAIANVVLKAEEVTHALILQVENLREQKQALMQQLLTGKRRVKVDDDRSLAQAGQI